MKGSDKQFIQGYNAQAVVDADTQIVVAAAVTNQAADAPHLIPMMEQVETNVDEMPEEVSALSRKSWKFKVAALRPRLV